MNSVVSDSPCASCAITKPCPLPSAFCLAAIFHFCTLPNVANWPLVFYDLLTTDKAHKQLPLRPPPQWQEPWCSKVLSPPHTRQTAQRSLEPVGFRLNPQGSRDAASRFRSQSSHSTKVSRSDWSNNRFKRCFTRLRSSTMLVPKMSFQTKK